MKKLPILSLVNIKKANSHVDYEFSIDIKIYANELKLLEYSSREDALLILNIILGFDLQYEGDYYIKGINISKLTRIEKRREIVNSIFFIPKENKLISELSVIDNILINLNWSNVWEGTKKDICILLERKGILHLANEIASELSSCDILKVLVLIAFLKNIKLIVIDVSFNISKEIKSNVAFIRDLIQGYDIACLLINGKSNNKETLLLKDV